MYEKHVWVKYSKIKLKLSLVAIVTYLAPPTFTNRTRQSTWNAWPHPKVTIFLLNINSWQIEHIVKRKYLASSTTVQFDKLRTSNFPSFSPLSQNIYMLSSDTWSIAVFFLLIACVQLYWHFLKKLVLKKGLWAKMKWNK